MSDDEIVDLRDSVHRFHCAKRSYDEEMKLIFQRSFVEIRIYVCVPRPLYITVQCGRE